MTQKNGTYKLVAGALTVVLAGAAGMWGMITVHAENPHSGALTRSEAVLQAQYLADRLDRIEAKLDHLIESSH